MARQVTVRAENLSYGSFVGRGRVTEVFLGNQYVHYFTSLDGWRKVPYGTLITVTMPV